MSTELPQTENTVKRFQTAKSTLLFDKFMNYFIKLGGIGIIGAVCGIFVFIFFMTLPLFSRAEVKPSKTYSVSPNQYEILGVDEWGEMPFLVDSSGTIHFVDLSKGGTESTINPITELDKTVTAVRYNENEKKIAYGTADGFFTLVSVDYSPDFSGEHRKINADVSSGPVLKIGPEGGQVKKIAFGTSDDQKLVAAVIQTDSGDELHAVRLTQERTLFSVGEEKVEDAYDLTSHLKEKPSKLLVNSHADELIVSTGAGKVYYFIEEDEEMELRQVFFPFEDLADSEIVTIDYALGEVSLIVSSSTGENRVLSLYVPEGSDERLFNVTKTFENLPAPATYFNASLRNKAFLIGSESFASLRYTTTESIRWQSALPFNSVKAVLGGKYDRILFLDQDSQLHVYVLKDPHPEAGFGAYFQKLWYEGYSEPSYEWQSTGGTDDFEPKLSLIPLIIGTLKGTFYAMFFALPIAILAALYTSQFAHPRFRVFVKPTMEIMASLPSVVLGFLAALWLAPIIETRLPSLILIITILPVVSFMVGHFWTSLPIEQRKKIKPGFEWIALFPILMISTYVGWEAGPWFEKIAFVVTDPVTGVKTADFRLWWPTVTGFPFEQRNSLVVGFMMGFAVIPIIFTIAEDSLSNVPRALVSGSLALGASRWQTAIRVVMPTAFPGIFSGIMIGLGRAVGETMIVVMATGNTPIMDFNIFSGMRTLSANIAVELPEAPYLGTLYRTLFLGALVLFMMTFFVNTLAEIIRQRLREKYRTV